MANQMQDKQQNAQQDQQSNAQKSDVNKSQKSDKAGQSNTVGQKQWKSDTMPNDLENDSEK